MEEKKKPVLVIREGAVAASIWSRKGKRGLYWEFTIARCFKDDTDQFRYTPSFRARDSQAVTRCIEQACERIRKQYEVRPTEKRDSSRTETTRTDEPKTSSSVAERPKYAVR